MELSIKTMVLLLAVITTGLSAGLFTAWQISVIPGTKRIGAMTYLETMQSINQAILNPAFFLVFFGAFILVLISTIQQYGNGQIFGLLLAASITYLLGTIGVTLFGNVPLNDSLDVLNLGELIEPQVSRFRENYELRWNRFHLVRTLCSLVAFLFTVYALLKYSL